jgi:hypothetical protein
MSDHVLPFIFEPGVRAAFAVLERAEAEYVPRRMSAMDRDLAKLDLADAVLEATEEPRAQLAAVRGALRVAYAPGAYGPEAADQCFALELARRGYVVTRSGTDG